VADVYEDGLLGTLEVEAGGLDHADGGGFVAGLPEEMTNRGELL
jgi:hypothetical protein